MTQAVTVSRIIGMWFGVTMDGEQTAIVTQGSADKKTATVAAKKFAKVNQLFFTRRKLIISQPFMTMMPVPDSPKWTIVKITSESIEYSGIYMSIEDIMRDVEKVAEHEQLEFDPGFGHVLFFKINPDHSIA